jgi:hypothetical protein
MIALMGVYSGVIPTRMNPEVAVRQGEDRPEPASGDSEIHRYVNNDRGAAILPSSNL